MKTENFIINTQGSKELQTAIISELRRKDYKQSSVKCEDHNYDHLVIFMTNGENTYRKISADVASCNNNLKRRDIAYIYKMPPAKVFKYTLLIDDGNNTAENRLTASGANEVHKLIEKLIKKKEAK